jgi:hypothetical protein
LYYTRLISSPAAKIFPVPDSKPQSVIRFSRRRIGRKEAQKSHKEGEGRFQPQKSQKSQKIQGISQPESIHSSPFPLVLFPVL